MTLLLVCREGELPEGAVRIVAAGADEIGVFYRGGEYRAYLNRCLHQGGPACEGIHLPRVLDVVGPGNEYRGQTFAEGTMHFICPWHGWEYDVDTGECVADRSMRLRRYDIVRQDGRVYVRLA